MSRKIPEWVGKTDDTDPPPRVKRRVAERQGWICPHCGLPFREGDPTDADHIVALIDHGENRETNLQILHRDPCHRLKTKGEGEQRKRTRRLQNKRLGIKSKPRGGGFRTNRDGPWKKLMDGTVIRRN